MTNSIRTGRPDVRPDAPSHTAKVRQGNEVGGYERMSGHEIDGRASAARSTGINPEDREPIDPAMPGLFPA
ncbi:hypothetical protein Misp01_44060 [Microtetraspora sp. NBRC 13810]|uniref:hypothetical protein n=1 Tax=Microtetraspora sp. NBRC 13810 TaxID=3030990 RepID=UPI0024A316FF|nr:hypothetical protein [Microtetraspora sp. NBRC 13810]GLW09277.1 hypothetical protein Misp01_44060 [Microtetraspora sp. NBRC 13810]